MGESLITARSNIGHPNGYDLLSAGFASYTAALTSGAFKARIAELEAQWQLCGLTG